MKIDEIHACAVRLLEKEACANATANGLELPVFVRSSGADSDTNQIVVAMCKHSGQVDITIIEATIGDECIDGFRDESLERACESADDLGVKKVTISAFSVDEIQAIRDVCDYVLRDLGAES